MELPLPDTPMSAITPLQARRDYFHYLSERGRRFITYREWKRTQTIEVITTPYLAALIKKTGYPGHSEIDDLWQWVIDEIALIDLRFDDLRDILVLLIDANMSKTMDVLINSYVVINGIINTVFQIMQEIQRSLTTLITKTGEWVTNVIENTQEKLDRTIEEVGTWIDEIGLRITDAITASIDASTERFEVMYEQFADAIDSSIRSGESSFNLIGEILIVGIKGVVDLAISIVDGLSSIIASAVAASERTLTSLIDGIVVMVDTLVTGAKEIIEGTINKLIDWLKWLWDQFTKLLDQAFDLDLESMAPMFVKLFDAQKRAFELIKERAETVQP